MGGGRERRAGVAAYIAAERGGEGKDGQVGRVGLREKGEEYGWPSVGLGSGRAAFGGRLGWRSLPLRPGSSLTAPVGARLRVCVCVCVCVVARHSSTCAPRFQVSSSNWMRALR